jgi:hypothetical protein
VQWINIEGGGGEREGGEGEGGKWWFVCFCFVVVVSVLFLI